MGSPRLRWMVVMLTALAPPSIANSQPSADNQAWMERALRVIEARAPVVRDVELATTCRLRSPGWGLSRHGILFNSRIEDITRVAGEGANSQRHAAAAMLVYGADAAAMVLGREGDETACARLRTSGALDRLDALAR